MKIRIITIFLVLTVVVGHAVAQSTIKEKVDEYIQGYLEMDRFSGAVLIAKDDEILLSQGYGYANREHSVHNTPETKFRLGSITKQFTTMLIMQLHEEGELSITDPISTYLPDYPDGDRFTIHHLMSHTAGIPNFTSFDDYEKTMMIPATLDEIISRFQDKPLEFESGRKYSYSNSGYLLLGYILESISGKTYAELIRERIFDRVGMDDSGYDDPVKIIENRASGYAYDGQQVKNASYIDMSIPHAAGALYSTVMDLYKWDRVLYTDELLGQEYIEKMFTPVMDNYGYGWIEGTLFNRKMVSHGGGINGFQTNIVRFTDDNICLIILSNIIPAPISEMTRDIAAIIFDEPYELPKEKSAIEISENTLDQYAGKYKLAPDFILTVTREGRQLYTQATGQQRVEIYPSSESEFFLRVVEAEIHFLFDDEGEVSGLVLHQGGMQMQAEKIE